MYQKLTRLLLFFLVVLSAQAAVAQSKPAYQYMQLFYYGTKTMTGSVGHFSPAMRGLTDITLAAPTAYMQRMVAQLAGPAGSPEAQQNIASASTDIIDLTTMTPAQRKQYAEQERKQQKQEKRELQENLEKFARLTNDHTKALTDQVAQSLNTAAADGWEVVQMSNFGTDGLVYLLRKAK